jgi:hypothetical protein
MGTAWKFFFPDKKDFRLVRLEVCGKDKILKESLASAESGPWRVIGV